MDSGEAAAGTSGKNKNISLHAFVLNNFQNRKCENCSLIHVRLHVWYHSQFVNNKYEYTACTRFFAFSSVWYGAGTGEQHEVIKVKSLSSLVRGNQNPAGFHLSSSI